MQALILVLLLALSRVPAVANVRVDTMPRRLAIVLGATTLFVFAIHWSLYVWYLIP